MTSTRASTRTGTPPVPSAPHRPAWLSDLTPSLLAILGVAFVLRLSTILWLSDTVPFSDYFYYHMAGEQIAKDWTFFFDRTAAVDYGKFGWWPPIYPFVIGALYALFGVEHRVVVYLQVILGTLVCWLAYRIGRDVAGERVGRIAALLVAINPTYIFVTNLLASENVYVLLLAAGLALAVRLDAASPRRAWIVCGVTFALGALTRAIGLLVPAVVALWLRRRAPTRALWLRRSAWLLGACALTIAPWTLRNAIVVGSPAIVCFGGGLNFYFGHNEVRIGYRDLSQTPMAQLGDQVSIDAEGYRLGWQCIGRAPWNVLTRGAVKVRDLFGSAFYAPHSNSAILVPDGWQTDPVKGQIAAQMRAKQRAKNVYLDGVFTWLANLYSWAVLAGALTASTLLWRRLPDGMRLMTFLGLYWIVSHAVFWGQPRFRYPMELPLALLTAFVIAAPRTDMGRAARAR